MMNSSNGDAVFFVMLLYNHKLKKHKPESYLTYCLNVEFDKSAKCPKYEKSIAEIFENAANTDWAVANHWEILGYLIQPVKNIPSWFVLYGRGNNGKSYMTSVWSALMGNSVLPRSITEFADTSRNNQNHRNV